MGYPADKIKIELDGDARSLSLHLLQNFAEASRSRTKMPKANERKVKTSHSGYNTGSATKGSIIVFFTRQFIFI